MTQGRGRRLVSRVHLIAAVAALLLVTSFWVATVSAELFLGVSAVVLVKRWIAGGIALLVPALIATGASGRWLAGRVPVGLAAKKLARTKLVAATGVFVLVPCALSLASLAERGAFSTLFYVLQGLELAAGASNAVLLARNARDGLTLSGRRLPRRARA